MFKDDGTVIHFTNPKVQASIGSNTFSVTGHSENKPVILLSSKQGLLYLHCFPIFSRLLPIYPAFSANWEQIHSHNLKGWHRQCLDWRSKILKMVELMRKTTFLILLRTLTRPARQKMSKFNIQMDSHPELKWKERQMSGCFGNVT